MSDTPVNLERELEAVIADYRNAEDALTRLRVQYAKLQAASSQLDQARADLDRDRVDRSGSLATAAEELSAQVAALASISLEQGAFVGELNDLTASLGALTRSIETLDPPQIIQVQEELTREMTATTGELREARRTLGDVERQLNEIRSALSLHDKGMNDVRASVSAITSTLVEHREAETGMVSDMSAIATRASRTLSFVLGLLAFVLVVNAVALTVALSQ
jgi:chromosome segregation ATPase